MPGTTDKEFAEKRTVKKALFEVHCSKGTYIRTLCHDIGEKLGCGGHMSFLIRTKAGRYSLETALTLEEIKELSATKQLEQKLIPVETVFEELNIMRLDEKDTFKYSNGVWLQVNNSNFDSNTFIRVYDSNGNFLGIGEFFNNGETRCLRSKKFFKE